MKHHAKGVYKHQTGKWRVDIMVDGERMTKVCYSYDEAIHAADYIRSFLKLKYQGQKGQIMYTINKNGQIQNEGRIISRTNEAAQNAHVNALQTFTFPATGQAVRIIEKDGQPWFVARDVAECLEYNLGTNLTNIFKNVPDQWKGINPINTLGGTQNLLTIFEQGLYFFLGRSDKPKALPYQMWIAGEVVPAIRRTGGYMISRPDDTPEELLSRALIIAKEALDRKTLALEVAQPKANKYDKFLDTSGTFNLTQAAKQFGVSAMTLGKALREGSSKWLFKTEKDDINMPMQNIIDKGYMVVISVRKGKTGQVFTQGRFTTKGMNALFEQFGHC